LVWQANARFESDGFQLSNFKTTAAHRRSLDFRHSDIRHSPFYYAPPHDQSMSTRTGTFQKYRTWRSYTDDLGDMKSRRLSRSARRCAVRKSIAYQPNKRKAASNNLGRVRALIQKTKCSTRKVLATPDRNFARWPFASKTRQ